MILPASYANGFAPRDGQPLYPELWRGCVGAWAPCLGPSGLTLRDQSKYFNNGDLVNGTVWLPRQGRYATYFDGTDDRVTMSIPFAMASNWSVYACGIWDALREPCAIVGSTTQEIVSDALGYFGTQRIGGYSTVAATTAGAIVVGRVSHTCVTMSGAKRVTQSVNAKRSESGNPDMSAYDVTLPTSLRIASSGLAGRSFIGSVFEVRIYNRVLTTNEELLLTSRIGIAYELAPRRRASLVAGFNRRRRLLIGASS